MKTLSMTLAALSLSGLCNLALADANPLSVHVLNLENGLPSAGVNVTLEQHVGDKWQSLSEGVTNQQGRIAELFPANRSLQPGEYRVVFKTGDYYKKANRETFFPRGTGDIPGQAGRPALPHPAAAQPLRLLHLSRFIGPRPAAAG